MNDAHPFTAPLPATLSGGSASCPDLLLQRTKDRDSKPREHIVHRTTMLSVELPSNCRNTTHVFATGLYG